MRKFKDDRRPDELDRYPCIVMGRDTFMSGWGEATGGDSYAGWACCEADLETVEAWVRARGDQENIQVTDDAWRPPGACDHYHIYVCRPGHPALAALEESHATE